MLQGMVGKNGTGAADIMKDWIQKARGECSKEAQVHPRNQNVFDKCVHPRHEGDTDL